MTPQFDRIPMPRQTGIHDGIMLVDKPSGPTSHDIVAMVRRHFRFDKVGHGGTLDPQATGLLVILIERGTKLSSSFLNSDKTYEGTIRFGISTDSQDAQGKVIREADASAITRETLLEGMRSFTGDLMQAPPMVSAAKRDGVPLYKLARQGKTIEREARLIHVYKFELVDFTPPRASFVLQCTKGTYVRTICSDLGDKFGCGAHLEQLRRTMSGDMRVENAISLDDLGKMNRDQVLARIIPLHKVTIQKAMHPAGEPRQNHPANGQSRRNEQNRPPRNSQA